MIEQQELFEYGDELNGLIGGQILSRVSLMVSCECRSLSHVLSRLQWTQALIG